MPVTIKIGNSINGIWILFQSSEYFSIIFFFFRQTHFFVFLLTGSSQIIAQYYQLIRLGFEVNML